ncbi:hypothetical protein [Streptomyces sp. 6N223]|uniref:hypothetical protein n=1 Tax=Streptomyces sp. 6N223 TaxID=3457412 RepID=UPI003FD4E3F6
MKNVIIAAAALAVTAPLLVACNGGRDCDSAPAPQDAVSSVSSADQSGTGEAAFEQVAAPERSSGGRGGGGYRGSVGGSGDDCDDD